MCWRMAKTTAVCRSLGNGPDLSEHQSFRACLAPFLGPQERLLGFQTAKLPLRVDAEGLPAEVAFRRIVFNLCLHLLIFLIFVVSGVCILCVQVLQY